MEEQKRKRGRPCTPDNLVQFQLRLEPELIQQLKCRAGKGKVSTFVRDAIKKELQFSEGCAI
jgi:predicted HicB family RNase H-like nuclease